MRSLENHWQPPTALTPQPNRLIFWQEAPYLIAFRGTEAIWEFHPMSRDINKKLTIFAQFCTVKRPKIGLYLIF